MLNCEDPPLDICLVIDQTESVKVKNYKLMIESVDDFTHFFVIGENKTRFAIITFAKEPSVRINFSSVDHQNQQKLSELFKDMMNDKLSSPTRTDRALAMAGNEVFNEANGDRPHAPDALIVLTDGKTHDDSEPFETVLKPIEVSFRLKFLSAFILQAKKVLKCDWLRPAVFQPDLKYLHVKITVSMAT